MRPTRHIVTSEPRESEVRVGTLPVSMLIGHSAWALGVSRRMLDELSGLVRSKVGRPGTMADSLSFQTAYGEAEARWHAGRCFVYETWRGASGTIRSGAALSVEQKTLLRLALYNATWAAEAISVAAYPAGGPLRCVQG